MLPSPRDQLLSFPLGLTYPWIGLWSCCGIDIDLTFPPRLIYYSTELWPCLGIDLWLSPMGLTSNPAHGLTSDLSPGGWPTMGSMSDLSSTRAFFEWIGRSTIQGINWHSDNGLNAIHKESPKIKFNLLRLPDTCAAKNITPLHVSLGSPAARPSGSFKNLSFFFGHLIKKTPLIFLTDSLSAELRAQE